MVVSHSDNYFIISILKSCAELTALYTRNNSAVVGKLKLLSQRALEVMEDAEQFSIKFENGTIAINGKTITHNQSKRVQTHWLLELGGKNQLSEIVFKRDVDADGLFHLGKVLQQASLKRIEFKILQKNIETGCKGSVYFVHISGLGRPRKEKTVNKKEEAVQSPRKVSTAAQAGVHKYSGRLKASLEVSSQRLFEIPEVEKRALALFVSTQIEKGNRAHLFQNLAEMMRDMKSADMETAFLGLNSLKWSTETLMKMGQLKFMFKVSDELFANSAGILRDDIFEIVVDLQLSILKYFRAKQTLPPYINGIRMFAQLSKTQESARRQKANQAINSLLDVKFTSYLLTLTMQTHALQNVITKLFSQHAGELADPLFMLLFQSEKRTERKRVLTFLTQAGEQIMPHTIFHLQQAVKNGSPWYVKRNLLFLFCRFPSNRLGPIIDALAQDPHPRLQEQLLLACLRLKSPKAVEFGTQCVANRSFNKLPSVLSVVAQVKNKAYDAVLIKRFLKVNDEAGQLKIMEVLQVLDTQATRSFFEDILTARKMVALRYSGVLRSEAAKSLYMSESRQLFKLFSGLKNDKEVSVKSWAQRFISEKGPPPM